MQRILLIEDNGMQREFYKNLLEHAGYEVVEAPDGQTGLRLFSQQPYDLVMTDIYMPGQDGIETISALQKHSPAVRILAISGGGDRSQKLGEEAYLQEILKVANVLGADASLTKPIKRQQLLQTIETLLQQPS